MGVKKACLLDYTLFLRKLICGPSIIWKWYGFRINEGGLKKLEKSSPRKFLLTCVWSLVYTYVYYGQEWCGWKYVWQREKWNESLTMWSITWDRTESSQYALCEQYIRWWWDVIHVYYNYGMLFAFDTLPEGWQGVLSWFHGCCFVWNAQV